MEEDGSCVCQILPFIEEDGSYIPLVKFGNYGRRWELQMVEKFSKNGKICKLSIFGKFSYSSITLVFFTFCNYYTIHFQKSK